MCARGAGWATSRGPSTSPLDGACSPPSRRLTTMLEALADGVASLLGSLIIGWRSALGLALGIALACFIGRALHVHGRAIWALVALAAFCYLLGLWWELRVRRRRRALRSANGAV